MPEPQALCETLATCLRGLGIAADPAALIRTTLLRGGYFAGHKFRFEGGHALWVAEGSTIEVYDEAGKLLTTIGLETSGERRAA